MPRFDVQLFTEAAGDVLRRTRRERGLTLHDVSRLSKGRFKPSILGGYERGERMISLCRFAELAELYGVPADRLLADILALMHPPGRSEIVIDLGRLALLSESEVRAVAEFIHDVRLKRGDYFTDVISLRSGDLEALALRTGVEPRSLLSKLRPALRSKVGTNPANSGRRRAE